ncbi:hypothetical protein HAHE_39740 [Haloferula helveola]|uniref:Lipoprotein n=1 Tax=Haloferula helveola TaxID=490095 RepID=A0ABM7REJ5_9BACT|nr:hypothetical protein HAHE_39740 [Haloferula helveola]
MKIVSLLISTFAVLTLSSCVVDPYPPVSGPIGASHDAERKAYEQGFGFGRKDARAGRNSNFMLYNNYYNSSTKKEFQAGYNAGYRRGR